MLSGYYFFFMVTVEIIERVHMEEEQTLLLWLCAACRSFLYGFEFPSICWLILKILLMLKGALCCVQIQSKAPEVCSQPSKLFVTLDKY